MAIKPSSNIPGPGPEDPPVGNPPPYGGGPITADFCYKRTEITIKWKCDDGSGDGAPGLGSKGKPHVKIKGTIIIRCICRKDTEIPDPETGELPVGDTDTRWLNDPDGKCDEKGWRDFEWVQEELMRMCTYPAIFNCAGGGLEVIDTIIPLPFKKGQRYDHWLTGPGFGATSTATGRPAPTNGTGEAVEKCGGRAGGGNVDFSQGLSMGRGGYGTGSKLTKKQADCLNKMFCSCSNEKLGKRGATEQDMRGEQMSKLIQDAFKGYMDDEDCLPE